MKKIKSKGRFFWSVEGGGGFIYLVSGNQNRPFATKSKEPSLCNPVPLQSKFNFLMHLQFWSCYPSADTLS